MANEIPTSKRQAVHKRDGRHCQRCGVGCMTGEIHHRRSRSVRDDHTHCLCNLVYLCNRCHRFLTEHPMDGYLTGWMVRRARAPFGTPFKRWDRAWALPMCEGTYDTVGAEELMEDSLDEATSFLLDPLQPL